MKCGVLCAGRSVRSSLFCFACMLVLGVAHAATAPQPPEWVAPFADRIVDAWRTGAPMPQLSVAHPETTLADGYAIQALVVKALHVPDGIGAFKAAIVGAAGREAMGLKAPLVAVIPASGLLRADDEIVVDLSQDPSRHLETEIGYIFGSRVASAPMDVAELKAAVRAIAPIVEVPGGPVEQGGPATAADLAAWNINAKEIIVGKEHAPEPIDPDTLAITLKRDGETINTAKGSDAAGGQWQTLLETVQELVRLGYTLEPGQVITNGALGKVVKAEPGAHVADFGALGTIAFEVRPAAK